MKFHAASLLALLPALAEAQRPSNVTICNYYTGALLNTTDAASQYKVLTLLVNTAVIGNWTPTPANIKVNGILNNGTYNGTSISLLPYFNGMLKSANRSGVATAVNFLDDGGAAPLMMAMPANGTSSNQYKLLTHLYEFFGALLGCSGYGNGTAFPTYSGNTNMYAVHGFMGLNQLQNGYFIQQVGMAAASFGVATSDVQYVGNALDSLFNKRCSAPAAILPGAPAQPQAICIAASCPLAANATCAAYMNGTTVMTVNGTNYTSPSSANASSSSSSGSGSSGTATTASKSWAKTNAPVLGSVALGLLGVLAL